MNSVIRRVIISLIPFLLILLAPLVGLAVACDPSPNAPTPALVTFTPAPHYDIPSVTASPFVNTLIAPRTNTTDPTVVIMPVTDTPVSLPTSALTGIMIAATETADTIALTSTPIDTIVPGRNTLTVEGTQTPTPADTPAPVLCEWQTLYRDEQTWLQRCMPSP